MKEKGFFYAWVPTRLHLPLLLLLLVPLAINNGFTSGISTYAVGSLGVIPADITMAANAYSIGLVCGLPLFARIDRAIRSKRLLLWVFTILVLVNYVLQSAADPLILILGSFVIGTVKIIGLLQLSFALLPILAPHGERLHWYAVYYLVVLFFAPVSSVIAVTICGWVNLSFSFQVFTWILLGGMLLVLILMHDDFAQKRIPLYQFDWPGMILTTTMLLGVSYILSYGLTEDWLNSTKIRMALAFSAFTIAILIGWVFRRKRPFLAPFPRYRPAFIGFFCMFCLSVSTGATSLLSSFESIMLRGNPLEISWVNAYVVCGYIAGMLFSYLYYPKPWSFKMPLFIACACYLAGFLQLYLITDQSAGPHNLFFPQFFRGAGAIITYISIALYVTGNVPPSDVFPSIFYFLAARFFIGPAVWSCILGNLYYQKVITNIDRLATKIDRLNNFPAVNGRTANPGNSLQTSFASVRTQASLLAIREIFGLLILGGILSIAALSIYQFWKRLKGGFRAT